MTPTTKRALERASEHFGRVIKLSDLHYDSRAKIYTYPRYFVAAYLAAQDFVPKSLKQIALDIGRTDHATVINALRHAEALWPNVDFAAMAREDFAELKAERARKASAMLGEDARKKRVMRMLREGRRNFMPWRYLNGAGWTEEAA